MRTSMALASALVLSVSVFACDDDPSGTGDDGTGASSSSSSSSSSSGGSSSGTPPKYDPYKPPQYELDEMDLVCNLQVTYDYNKAKFPPPQMGANGSPVPINDYDENVDAYAPSPTCRNKIRKTIPFVDSVPNDVREATIAALHALWYSPISRFDNDKIMNSDVAVYPQTFKEYATAGFDDGLMVLPIKKSGNGPLRDLWYRKIYEVKYEANYGESGATIAEYGSGTITLHLDFANVTVTNGDDVRLYKKRRRYELGSVIFHEILHGLVSEPAKGGSEWNHEKCAWQDQEKAAHCDHEWEHSPYAMEASILDGLVIGGIRLAKPGAYGVMMDETDRTRLLSAACQKLKNNTKPSRDEWGPKDCASMGPGLAKWYPDHVPHP